jgi:hypothetical protein
MMKTEYDATARGASDLVARLRRVPELDPPDDLTPRIMAAVRTRPRPWWQKALARLNRPMTLTFAPLKWIPAVVLTALAVVWLMPGQRPAPPAPGPANPADGMVALTLTFEHPLARSVALIGSFNGWDPGGASVITERQNGTWRFHLRVPPGQYAYAFLVDNHQVVADPRAVFSRRDGFGATNSILYADPNGEVAL